MNNISVNKRLIPLADQYKFQKHWYNIKYMDDSTIIIGIDLNIDTHRIIFRIKRLINELHYSK